MTAAGLAIIEKIIESYPALLAEEKSSYSPLYEENSQKEQTTPAYSEHISGKGGRSDPTASAATQGMSNMTQEKACQLKALRLAVSKTHHFQNGLERLQVINFVYWKHTHTLAEAAQPVPCYEADAQAAISDFIALVEDALGLSECKGCIYWRTLLPGTKSCHYCFDRVECRICDDTRCYSKCTDIEMLKKSNWYLAVREPAKRFKAYKRALQEVK